jgi:hypothetical protein
MIPTDLFFDERRYQIDQVLEAGIFSATTQKRLTELEKEKEAVEIPIAKEELRAKTLNEGQVLDFLCHFQNGDVNDINYRRQLIDCFVNRSFLYDDRMVLTFNTSNNTKEISFDLVEGSDMVEGPPLKRTLESLRFQGSYCFYSFSKNAIKYKKMSSGDNWSDIDHR